MTGWRAAWERAHLGPGGFYRRTGPASHFRTAAAHAGVLAQALATLVATVDERLGRPDPLDIVDVGAGDGALLAAVVTAVEASDDAAGRRDRLRPLAIDVRARPEGLADSVEWAGGEAVSALDAARPAGIRGLLLAWELLDDVPCDVVLREPEEWRLLLVEAATGLEHPGPLLTDGVACATLGVDARAARSWLATWRPGARPGDRAEVGTARDRMWADLVRRLRSGTALAVDYAQPAGPPAAQPAAQPVAQPAVDMSTRVPATLTAYAHGRRLDPVPDGSCNITAHVDLASCAAAAERGGRVATTLLTRQHRALRRLGVSARPPAPGSSRRDPATYLDTLATAGTAATLLDPSGLGSFGWLAQEIRA